MKRLNVNIQRYARTGFAGLCVMLSGAAQAAPLDLVCAGNSYSQEGPFPTTETFTLRIGGTKSVLIGGPGAQQPVKAPIISNNIIQLKFKTGSYTGEYFHFTGDLFLIRSNGRLTRLNCKPS